MKNFDFDKKIIKPCKYLIGTDEAGRGPGAGPVFAAAVCFKKMDRKIIRLFGELNDSKKLSEKKREELFFHIKNYAFFEIVSCNVEQIEQINILQASLLAMGEACRSVAAQLNCPDVKVIVDGRQILPVFAGSQDIAQENIIKGDEKSASIAAASILAKVARDAYMKKLDEEFPQYKWAKNKGYLTQEHLSAIREFGITSHHRKKFLRKIYASQIPLNF